MGPVGSRQQHETPAFHALDFALRQPKFGRVDEIIGRVDLGQGDFDFLERRRGIVIAGCAHLVEQIVGVQFFEFALHELLQELVRGIPSRERELHLNGSTPGDHQEACRRAQRTRGLALVVALQPLRIAADSVREQLAPQAVAARNLHRQTGERHQGIHEIRKRFPPHERVHAAHRGSHHQPQVVHLETLQHQGVLGSHHVRIGVLREACAQAVAGFARFSVTDPVRQNYEILIAVEQLTAPEQHAGEMLVEQTPARAAGAVQDQDRIVYPAVRVALRLA